MVNYVSMYYLRICKNCGNRQKRGGSKRANYCRKCFLDKRIDKGGKYIKDGYIFIRKTQHPFAASNGYVREHRLIMEKFIGRYLDPDEFVHHLNMNRSDNRIENLILFSSRPEHQKRHYPRGSRFGINS